MSHVKHSQNSEPKRNEKSTTTQFYVGGMACAFCASTIEKGLRQVSGVESSKVLMESGEVFIRHDPAIIDKERVRKEIERLGYYVFERTENMSTLILRDSKKRSFQTWVLAVISFSIVSPMMFPTLYSLLGISFPVYYNLSASFTTFIIATVALFYFALPIHRGTIVALRKRILNEHVLYGVAGFGAYILGIIGFVVPAFRPFLFIAILLTALHLTAGWMGARLRFSVEKSVRTLMDLRPPMARVLKGGGGQFEDAPVSSVNIGDLVLVRPGERIPLDGIITEGRSEVSEAILSGESSPIFKDSGDEVIGGSTNGSGTLTVRATSDFSGSYISRILGLVKSTKQTRSTLLTFFDRVVDRIWVPLVLVIAFATFIGWMALGFVIDNPSYWETGVIAGLLVAVIGYPCAIGFSAPSVGLSVFSEYADNGILVKDTSMFERLKDVRAVIFDKTGTLTYGSPKVIKTVTISGDTEAILLKYAASLEGQSSHPIARAIDDEAEQRNVPTIKVEDFEEIRGAGIKGLVNGNETLAGKPEFFEARGFHRKEIESVLTSFGKEAKSPVLVGVADSIIGGFDIADAIRPDAKHVIVQLKRMGLNLLMLTGDTERAASEISKELGGINYLARQTPDDKIKIVHEYKEKHHGGKVLMVGDGLNDAAALAAADVGIATAASIDVSKDVADAVLISSNNLSGIVSLFENSKATSRASASNVLLALGFNAVGMPLAILGLLTPAYAMIIMVLSLFGVFINAYLTKRRLGSKLEEATRGINTLVSFASPPTARTSECEKKN